MAGDLEKATNFIPKVDCNRRVEGRCHGTQGLRGFGFFGKLHQIHVFSARDEESDRAGRYKCD
ncbi:MAG: hypothetical protein JWN45_978 [Acidobacteriaceae bacterium]|nr:hypothetical protein [Acidobacteriaceae bacterium]